MWSNEERNKHYVSSDEIAAQERVAACIRSYFVNAGLTPSYFIEVYGCQMNVRDAETMAALFLGMGFSQAPDMDSADVILFHTCCVRDHAEKRVFGNIGALREWRETSSQRILIVSGCMMQQKEVAQRLFRRFPFVDIVFGTHAMYRLPQMIQSAIAGERVMMLETDADRVVEGLASIRQNPISAFVNIMYGCNNFCSYCIVPYVRGRERSRTPEDILSEVSAAISSGCQEVTLLGQNVNSYCSPSDGTRFPKLLSLVASVDDLKRLRFMTSHPKDLSEELVRVMADTQKVCHHIHLPVQSGSDRILSAMNRKYTRDGYLDKIRMLKDQIPDVCISTDIIVGFPGETEQDFRDTLDLVEKAAFSSAYTFLYSPRKGTRAADMPDQVEEAIKKERLKRLNALQQRMTDLSNTAMIGKVGEILVEGVDDRSASTAYGKLPNLKMVYIPGNADLIGSFVPVEITGCNRNSLTGRALNG